MQGKLAIIAAAVLIGTAGTYILNENTVERDTVEIQQEIAQKILRFHVLANSDSEEDQALKLKVKEGVTGYLDQYLNEDGMTLDETKEIVEDKKEDVIVLAQEIIRENGYDYSVTAELTTDYFPVKSYGDVTLPAGEYEAFRIKIGEAEGKNWWCILYPPLCFVDASYGYVPDASKQKLEKMLDADAYQTITDGGVAKGKVEVRSKIWDTIKKIF